MNFTADFWPGTVQAGGTPAIQGVPLKVFALILMCFTVYVLHQDWWNWAAYKPLLFGFVPIGLWYHALFACLCALNMWVLGRLAWPKHLEVVEAEVLKQPTRGGGH